MAGVVTLSIEIELGWGVHDIDEFAHLSDRGRSERRYLTRLLDLTETLDLPISFDVVGHLCRVTCDGVHDGPHEPGWFESDPGTDVATNPLFYAPDAIDDVAASAVDHELCTHTYSHVPCHSVARETLAWELEQAQSQLQEFAGSRTVSIVPPRHYRPPADALREAGIETMRICRDTSDRSRPARAKELVLGPHPVFEPRVVDGVVETYCTSYPSLTSAALPAGQRRAARPFSAMPVRTRQYLQRRYLRRAVDDAAANDHYTHLWCHLYDLSNPYQWEPIAAFLRHLASLREQGEIEVLTMAALNEHVRDRGVAMRA
ncbi:Polysaccharide deacetylase [Salinarchaeum sp. Harcht-Bsk1]|uniref:polysaccharide deacetylase family protein n=1 Tax=Salinarchaeum sp. Harcht-Bsk1 TaxID=1333523 RepID=UPI0003423EC3|nr:polysaccharide deacetylase family protein [Salinarchaeum sp. Harcht-Bsk1]AGN01461.1 Polysaccharide deacetylase [Salinarchaeum sp. Harcht-Bsk1]